jgi:WD40 repeat protein
VATRKILHRVVVFSRQYSSVEQNIAVLLCTVPLQVLEYWSTIVQLYFAAIHGLSSHPFQHINVHASKTSTALPVVGFSIKEYTDTGWGLFMVHNWITSLQLLCGAFVSTLCLVPIDALKIGSSLVSSHGVTSLLQHGSTIFAGTKRGDLLVLDLPSTGHDPFFEITVAQQTKVDFKTFPIYSLAYSSSGLLFCGCGDRYISVLSKGENQSAHKHGIQRLGQHTGWVKDLYLDSKSGNLFSIGCNCIEAWAPSKEGTWEHVNKRSITSSPTDGSTLSSDLLCLRGSPRNDFFYAGGVDGRIHVWSTDLNLLEPIISVGAHSGRVNVLMVEDESNLLFSAGNDGIVQCRHGGLQLLDDPVTTFHVGEGTRITAGTLTKLSDSLLQLIVGCSTGLLLDLRVEIRVDGMISISEFNRVTLVDECSIHSLLIISEKTTEPGALLIGHSRGLFCACLE